MVINNYYIEQLKNLKNDNAVLKLLLRWSIINQK